MTEPPATKPARVCVIVPQDHHQGQYVNWCKTHRQPASFCMNNVFPVHEGGGEVDLLVSRDKVIQLLKLFAPPADYSKDVNEDPGWGLTQTIRAMIAEVERLDTRTAQPAQPATDDCEALEWAMETYDKLQREHGSPHGLSAAEQGAFQSGWEARAAQPTPTTESRERAEAIVAEWGSSPVPASDFEASRKDLVNRIAAALSSIPEPSERSVEIVEEILNDWNGSYEHYAMSGAPTGSAAKKQINQFASEIITALKTATPSAELKQRELIARLEENESWWRDLLHRPQFKDSVFWKATFEARAAACKQTIDYFTADVEQGDGSW